MKGSAPDWSQIFAKNPHLEAPGYLETLQKVRDRASQEEAEKIRKLMQGINKERVSQRNKNRNKNKLKTKAG